MKLKALTSDQLLTETKTLVSEERRITAILIDHLSEINQRLLFLKLGYSSLFEFVTKELGLSEGAAQRRIQATRLMQDLPNAREAFENGSLSLSNAAKLQSHFQAIKKSGKTTTHEEKQAITKKAENKPQRECDQMLFGLAPELPKPEKAKILSPTLRELNFAISEELFQKINRLRDLLSHSHPKASLAELMELSVSSYLTKLEKTRGLQSRGAEKEGENQNKNFRENGRDRKVKNNDEKIFGESADKPDAPDANDTLDRTNTADRNHKTDSNYQIDTNGGENTTAKNTDKTTTKIDQTHLVHIAEKVLPVGVRVALPAQLKREVWNKADGRCEYVFRGRRCSSRYQLEIDHVQPLALGGSNELSNLRLTCRRHNRLAAIQALGFAKMNSFMNSKPK